MDQAALAKTISSPGELQKHKELEKYYTQYMVILTYFI